MDVLKNLPDDAVEAAPLLLGCTFVSRVDDVETSVRLTEVEAYRGSDDPASHAWRGRTQRNTSMFLGTGHLYVYLAYGIHVLGNVVIGAPGVPGAVLLRSGEPITGADHMEVRRGRRDNLARGPGRLGAALGLSLDHDGYSIGGGLFELRSRRESAVGVIRATPRVGISRAKDLLWRFHIDRT